MPVFGLGVFWLWPVQIAAPVYTLILIISVVLYVILMRTMKLPTTNGSEGLLHELGEVIRNGDTKCLVRVHGELWQAESDEQIGTHEIVEVTGTRGMVLTVRHPRSVASDRDRIN